MPLTKKQKEYIEFRRRMQPRQTEFRAMLGIIDREDDNPNRKDPSDNRHSDPKEAVKRIDEAMKWL